MVVKLNTVRLNCASLNHASLNGVGERLRASAGGGGGEVIPPDVPVTYTLNASVENGSVNATVNGVAVTLPYVATAGEVVKLEAVPNSGYVFKRWSDGVTSNPREVVMNSDLTYSAVCEAKTYILSASASNGVVSASVNGNAVTLPYTANEGNVVVVEVTANDGYEFEGWADGNTDNPRTITMHSDVTLSAECVAVVVKDYIQFADAEVEAVLMANGVSSDGVGITKEDAENVTSISTWFKGNTVIQKFDEFKEFINVTELGRNIASNSYAPFYNCTGLQTISFPPNLAYIRQFAFNGCTSLTSIGNLSEMSNSIKVINSWAFQNCTSLIIDNLNCPNLEELGDNALRGVRIRRIENLGKLTTMPAATGGQQNYGATDCLEYCSLPDTLSTIRGRSFQGYSVLKTLVIGTGCTAIEGYLVNNCKALTQVIVKATTPPNLDANAWYNANALTSIYVPDASVEAYKTATNWSQFSGRIKPLSEYVEE